MRKLPQQLVNVRIADRGALDGAAEVWAAVERESGGLEGRGRVLVRPSGTEPLVRVMVEAPDEGECEQVVGRLGRETVERARWRRSLSAIPQEPRIRLPPRSGPQEFPGAAAKRPLRVSERGPDRMCGIVGYVGGRPCRELLLEGLEKLEYRGYDSAGVSILEDGADRLGPRRRATCRSCARPSQSRANGRRAAVATATQELNTGIGHTRWATHGRVTEENAHPHFDTADRVHIVLNGIVENHNELRDRLAADGAEFTSETDAEVVAHLISSHYDGDLVAAVRAAYAELRGHYAFVAMAADQPGVLVGTRHECPLVVGVGEGEQFIASAIPAFLKETRRDPGPERRRDRRSCARTAPRSSTPTATPIERESEEVDWDEEAAEKGGYETFMLKEIHEQADAVAETVADRVIDDARSTSATSASPTTSCATSARITIVACGTSYHAGLVGRYAIEEWARLRVEMDIASEYRYRNPVVGPGRPRDRHLPVRRDARHARRHAPGPRRAAPRVLAITNVMGSQATRDADGVLFTRAGPEISVAATKTFVAQVGGDVPARAEARAAARDDVRGARRRAGRGAAAAAAR